MTPLSIHVYVLYMSLTILIHVYAYKDISLKNDNSINQPWKDISLKNDNSIDQPSINLGSTYKGGWVQGAWWIGTKRQK